MGLEAHRRETAQRALGLLDSGDVVELGGELAVLVTLVFGPDRSTIANAWHAVRDLGLAQTVARIPTRDVQAALDEIRPTVEPLLLELAWGGLSEGAPIAWTTHSGNRYIGWVLQVYSECTPDAVTAVTLLGAVWTVPDPEQPTEEEHHQLLEHQWAADDKGRTP